MQPQSLAARHIRLLLVACLALCAGAGAAQPVANSTAQPAAQLAAQSISGPVPGSLRETYPTGSIDDVGKADAALAASVGVRDHIEREFRANASDCSGTVMVNLCLERARDLRRRRVADVEGVELEANRMKRRDKADRIEADRVKREAERAANAPADAELRARNRKAFDDKAAQTSRDAAERVGSEARHAQPRKPHKPAVKVAPPAAAQVDAAMREKNAAAHALKLKDADQHLAEIQRRVATKAADRKRRDEEKAAKEAKEAKSAAAAAAVPRP